MDRQIDAQKTLEIIERMKLARIGDYKKWKAIIKKINSDEPSKSTSNRIFFKHDKNIQEF